MKSLQETKSEVYVKITNHKIVTSEVVRFLFCNNYRTNFELCST